MTALAVRTVAARPGRSFLTIAGVALGVGVLLAVLVTNVGIASGAQRAVTDLLGRADLRVSAFEERGLDEASLAAIAATPGVDATAGSIDRHTYLLPTVASGTSDQGELADPVRVMGIDPAAWNRLHELRIQAGDPLSTAEGDVGLVSTALAAELAADVGGQLTLLGDAAVGPLTIDIAGTFVPGGPDGRSERSVILPIRTAQVLFGTDGYDNVDVAIAEGATVSAVAAGLEQDLVTRPYVISTAAELTATLQAATAEFRTLAAMVAAVVLFVAGFLIFNTLSMTVTERLREVALLRAAGATAGQVHRLVLAIAAIIGTVGSVAGLLVGLLLAVAADWYVRSIDAFPIDAIEVPSSAVLVALVVGLLTTLVSGVEPALRAARVRPVEALRVGHDPVVGERARLRWLVVVFAVVAGAAVLLAPADAGAAGVIRSLAVYGLLLLAALLVPALLGPLGRLIGVLLRPFARAEERLSRGSIARDRSRAALAAGALGVGLAMVVALATVADGARAAGVAWLDDVIPGDLVVASIRPIGPDEGIETELAAVPGVERVTPFASFDVAYQGERLAAIGTRGSELAADGRLQFTDGSRDEALASLDAGGGAIVPRVVAQRLDLSVGDRLDLTTPGGLIALTVSGIVDRSMPGSTGEAVIVGYDDALERFGAQGADLFAVRYAPGAAATSGPLLDSVARAYALTPTRLADVESTIGNALERIVGLFDVVALLAVLVAGLGVANTFAMSVIERVPEIGILRATGMRRSQVERMVIVEALMLGGVGAIVGCVAGVVIGAATILLGGTRLDSLPLPPPTVLVAALAIGVLVPVVAAIYPARAAGRIPIVRAVAYR